MTMFQRIDPTTRQRSRGVAYGYSYSWTKDTVRTYIDRKDEEVRSESGSWSGGLHYTRAELTRRESMVE